MKLTSLRSKIRFEKKWPELLADILLAAVFVLGGMLLAHWIWLFFAPVASVLPIKSERSASTQSATILAGHWFKYSSSQVVAVVPSSVNFNLMGVYAPTDSTSGFAVFKMADGKQRSVLLKQEITPGVNLISVQQEGVEVGQDGATQYLKLPKNELAVNTGLSLHP
jgi:hypothetical protein